MHTKRFSSLIIQALTGVAMTWSLGLLSPAYAAPPESPPAAAGDEEEITEVIAKIRREVQATMTTGAPRLIIQDQRLGDIASWMAATCSRGPAGLSDVRSRLWQEGVREYEFLPVTACGRPDEVDAAVRSALQDKSIDWSRFNMMGLAGRLEGDGISVAILLTRRVVTFVGGDGGRDQAYLGSGFASMKLMATNPSGAVEQRDCQVADGLWAMDLSGKGEGTWVFELVGEGERGPEILALWTMRGGASSRHAGPFARRGKSSGVPEGTPADAASWLLGGGAGPDRTPGPEDIAAAEAHLWALIQTTRASRGLPALTTYPSVSEAARRHARDISNGDSFGHYTSSGTALDRLASQGVLASKVVENVGRAADVAAIHAALLASPAHRANLLNPDVSGGGVGVVLQRDARGRWTAVASELFVELLPSAERRAEQLADDLSRVREEAKLLPLRQSALLRKEANAIAQDVVDSGSLELTESLRRSIADRVRFHFVRIGRIGIDLMVTNDVTAGADIHHVRGRNYDEFGIGTARLTKRVGAHPPGTLVSVFIFAER